jgi:hypothetical protein
MKELIEKLNGLQIIQTSSGWKGNIPEDIYNEYLDGSYQEVEHDLDVDTHRWYETSTTVIKISGIFIGINYITNMFSESQNYKDCYHTIEFMEMEEYVTTSYRPKS